MSSFTYGAGGDTDDEWDDDGLLELSQSSLEPRSEGYDERTAAAGMDHTTARRDTTQVVAAAAGVAALSGFRLDVHNTFWTWVLGAAAVAVVLYFVWMQSQRQQQRVEMSAKYRLPTKRASLNMISTLPRGHITKESERSPDVDLE